MDKCIEKEGSLSSTTTIMTLMVIMALYNVVTAGHTWSQLVKLVIVKDLKIVDLKGYYDLV